MAGRALVAMVATLLLGCSSNTSPSDRGSSERAGDRGPATERRLVDGPPRDLPPPTAGAPAIFYTDLSSAPANAYVTLWGRGFGAAQGSSKVTHAGAAVAKIVSWSDRMIELRVSATPKPGDLVVTTAAGSSLPMPLGVHAGKIYFVATTGKDNWSGTLETPAGSDGPFRSLVHARDVLKPGDVVYVRASSFLQVDDYSAILSLRDVPTGTASAPIAIVGYPGEVATLGDNKVQRSFSLYRGDNGPPLHHLTIAKLRLKPSCDAIEIGTGDHGRFVGNEISGATDACQNGVIEAGGGAQGWKVLGNYIHGNGNTKYEHGIYLGGYGTQKGFEIAYNRIEQQKGGRAIQLFGHKPSDRIEQISIHDNEISEIDRDGIVLGATDADVLYLSDIRIYNNIFHRAGRCVGNGVRVGNSTATGIVVVHNTFVDNGRGDTSCHESSGESGAQIQIEDGAAVELRNNILVAGGNEKYLDMIKQPATFVGSNNLFSGGGTPPTWDPAPVSSDPLLKDVATHDFHVPSTSPAVGKGAAGLIAVDHDGEPRPPSAPTMGAYEPSR